MNKQPSYMHMQVRTFLIWIVSFLVIGILIGCKPKESKDIVYEYKFEVVSSKIVEPTKKGNIYRIAYESGDSETYDFGLYEKYSIGDTIFFKREENWFWYVIDKNKNNDSRI